MTPGRTVRSLAELRHALPTELWSAGDWPVDGRRTGFPGVEWRTGHRGVGHSLSVPGFRNSSDCLDQQRTDAAHRPLLAGDWPVWQTMGRVQWASCHAPGSLLALPGWEVRIATRSGISTGSFLCLGRRTGHRLAVDTRPPAWLRMPLSWSNHHLTASVQVAL